MLTTGVLPVWSRSTLLFLHPSVCGPLSDLCVCLCADTYGPLYFSSLLSIQVLLLASVGLFAPLLQHIVFARLRLPGTALGCILLVCAAVGLIPLACFHCTPCDEFDGKEMLIAGTGLPLALEKHSMAALFAQAGVNPDLIKPSQFKKKEDTTD